MTELTTRDKAKALYCHGGRTAKEIADKLGVPLNTVKSWQKRDRWNESRKEAGGAPKHKVAPIKNTHLAPNNDKGASKGTEETSAKPENSRRSQGAKGNMNAVGHGAPKGNKSGLRHGAYSIAKWGVLTDEEIDFIKNIAVDDTEAQLIQEVEMYTVREVRLLRAIKKVSESDDKKGLEGTFIESVTASEKRLARDPKKKVGVIEMHSTKTSVTNVILRMEKELSVIQHGKSMALQALAEYRAEMRENDNEDVIEQVKGMFAGIVNEANARAKRTEPDG